MLNKDIEIAKNKFNNMIKTLNMKNYKSVINYGKLLFKYCNLEDKKDIENKIEKIIKNYN